MRSARNNGLERPDPGAGSGAGAQVSKAQHTLMERPRHTPNPPRRASQAAVRAARRVLPLLSVLLLWLIAAPPPAAQTSDDTTTGVSKQWVHTPSGLEVGDTFRLMFVTSTTRDATSSSAADYTAFVQRAAASANADSEVRRHSSKFRALVATEARNALGNIAYGLSDTEPVYWLSLEKAADDGQDFWDGGWDYVEASDETAQIHPEHLPPAPFELTVFTGSRTGGGRALDGTSKYLTLGGHSDPAQDHPQDHSATWELIVDGNSHSLRYGTAARSGSHHIIAVSSPFEIVGSSVGLRLTSRTVNESEPITFTLDVNKPDTVASLDVNVRITDDDGLFLHRDDEGDRVYTVTGSSLQVSIPTIVDSGSASGSVTIEILPGADYGVGGSGATSIKDTATVNDNPAASGRALAVTGGSISEDNGGDPLTGRQLPFTFELNKLPAAGDTRAPSVRVSTVAAGGACLATATAGVDYTAVTNRTLRWTASSSKSMTTLVPVLPDSVHEGDETVCLKIDNALHLALPGGVATLYVKGVITENDPVPVISVSSPSVEEGAGTLEFQATLKGASANVVSVAYADSGRGTAESDTDYEALSAGTLSFAAGETSKTVTVKLTDDSDEEEDETVVLRFSKPVNAQLEGGARNLFPAGTITDDDAMARPTHRVALRGRDSRPATNIIGAAASAHEGDTLVFHADVFAMRGEELYDQAIDIRWSTLEGVDGGDPRQYGAKAGADFIAVTKERATIPKGATSVALEVRTKSDDADHPTRYFQIRIDEVILANGRTDVSFDPTPAKGEIYDGPTLAIHDAPKTVEGKVMVFPVTLGEALDKDIEVLWGTNFGLGRTRPDACPQGSRTGCTPGDYVDILAGVEGKLTIKAGETRASISVQTLQDTLDEPEEFFGVGFPGIVPEGVEYGRRNALGRIVDDDPAPGVSIADVSATEGEKLTFTVTLDKVSGKDVKLSWATR